jgi:two-component system, chemotaxis family, protein-glutamate methylesterase/glutaminase
MATRDLVVVGASAGGVEALRALVARLPPSFAGAMFVCVHVPAAAESVLPGILSRCGQLPAKRAIHGELYERGTIYVAPPDHHLMLLGERMRVTRGPRVNGHRPAIDPLFRSAARQFGPRVIGVVLSGVLDDGTAGMVNIKLHGGTTIVQSPSDALYPGMPTSVLERVAVDHAATAAGIADLLTTLTSEQIEIDSKTGGNAAMPKNNLELEEPNEEETTGPPSMFTCPDCNGSLWELTDGASLRYRCHVGHSYGQDSLLAGQSEALEEAVWAAYRALRESATLAKRLADRSAKQGLDSVAEQYRLRYEEAQTRAELLRGVLERGQLFAEDRRQLTRDS